MSTVQVSSKNAPPKLRSACDECHQAKVKCSGEAKCFRCLDRELNCRYSNANRIGKPKGSKNKKTLERLARARKTTTGILNLRDTPPLHDCPDFGSYQNHPDDIWTWDNTLDVDFDFSSCPTVADAGHKGGIELLQSNNQSFNIDSPESPTFSPISHPSIEQNTNQVVCGPFEDSSPREHIEYENLENDLSYIFSAPQLTPPTILEPEKAMTRPIFLGLQSPISPKILMEPKDTTSSWSICNCFTNLANSLSTLHNSTHNHCVGTGDQPSSSDLDIALLQSHNFLRCTNCTIDYHNLLLCQSLLRLIMRGFEELVLHVHVQFMPSPGTIDLVSVGTLTHAGEVLNLLRKTLEGFQEKGIGVGGKQLSSELMMSDVVYVRLAIERQEGGLELLKRAVRKSDVSI